jgi:hypothetical protein
MATYQIMTWHGIPVQVRAGGRRERSSIELPARFQEAVDSAAMAARLTGTEGYLAGFNWGETLERDGSPAEVAAAVAAELEAAYPVVDWRQTAQMLKDARAAGTEP